MQASRIAAQRRALPAEVSKQPRREFTSANQVARRVMGRFKSAGHAQRFLSAFGVVTSHFQVGRHLYRASGYREVMESRFAVWERRDLHGCNLKMDAIANG